MPHTIALTLLCFCGAELLDIRELRWHTPNLTERVAFLDGAPPLRDATRFHHLHCFDAYYLKCIELAKRGERERLHHAEEYHAYLRYCADMRLAISNLDDAQSTWMQTPWRRDALRKARRLLGEELWAEGVPP